MRGNEFAGNLFTTGEVARFLCLNKNTVRRWSDQGIIPTKRVGPRRDRVFSRQDIETFLDNRNGTGTKNSSDL